MPNGFLGRPPQKYLTDVSQAHSRAANVSQQAPSSGPRVRPSRALPFVPGDANNGRFATGRGDSSNIVANQEDYEAITRYVSQIDDAISECIYRTTEEIEEICQTIFILPSVGPRCIEIAGKVKGMMGQFRSLSDDATQQTRNYAREITEIG